METIHTTVLLLDFDALCSLFQSLNSLKIEYPLYKQNTIWLKYETGQKPEISMDVSHKGKHY